MGLCGTLSRSRRSYDAALSLLMGQESRLSNRARSLCLPVESCAQVGTYFPCIHGTIRLE